MNWNDVRTRQEDSRLRRSFPVLCAAIFLAGMSGCSDLFDRLESHPIGKTHQLILSEGSTLESSSSVFYEIRSGGKIVVPKTFLGGKEQFGNGGGKYLTMTANANDVVAFGLAWSPKKIVALFDLRSGDSWPRAHEAEVPPQTDQRGAALLRRLTGEANSRLELYR